MKTTLLTCTTTNEQQNNQGKRMFIPRDVLLIEIDRHCPFTDCNARNLIGLTKEEARAYKGFECEHCNRWSDDKLSQKDVPDWWDEIAQSN